MTEGKEPEKIKGNKPKTKRRRKKKSSERKIPPHFSPAEIKAMKEHLLKDLPKSDLKNMNTWDIRAIGISDDTNEGVLSNYTIAPAKKSNTLKIHNNAKYFYA